MLDGMNFIFSLSTSPLPRIGRVEGARLVTVFFVGVGEAATKGTGRGVRGRVRPAQVDWCGHCKTLMPTIEEVAQQHSACTFLYNILNILIINI